MNTTKNIKLMFIRLPRTASTTLANVPFPNYKFFGGKNMGFWPNKDHDYNNLAECIKNTIGDIEWEETFKFTIIRNLLTGLFQCGITACLIVLLMILLFP